MLKNLRRRLALGFLVGLAALPAGSQGIPAPRDVPHPGTVQLEVDASDTARRIYQVREIVPVTPGPLVLLYPKWLPGNHSTTGNVELLAGLVVSGQPGGQRLEWRRDPENMHAFHLEVPAGVDSLELRFQFLTPTLDEQGRRAVTPDLLRVHWEKALLYPAGYASRQIPYAASVRLPAGWAYATALDGAQRTGDTVAFAPVSLERLVDSPLYAGRHYRRYELDADPRAPVGLNVFAERPGELEASESQVEAHRRMVREQLALFGSRHYRRYEFLLAISDNLSGIGLEHHESSENGVGSGYFSDWAGSASVRDLLPHEMEHSWNGKFRRPADLATPSYEVPMRSSLLWVYEGMTEFWGVVLASTFGSWFGSTISYWVARWLGRPLILKYGKFVFVPEKKWLLAESWINQFSVGGVFFARLLPVVRHLVSLPAGAARMNFRNFSLATLTGSFLWSWVLAWFGAQVLGGEPRLLQDPEALVHVLKAKLLWIFAAAAVMLVLYVGVMLFGKKAQAARA